MSEHDCFERCEHDVENPYVQISRAMAQDKSISPKAKGVLLYLLSLPRNWKIYHKQLQHGLAVGEDYINSAMEELIKAGYADRKRERVKGIFQPYTYKIREFKKCSPSGENRPGFSGPENPGLQKKDIEKKQEHVVISRETADVFSDAEEKPPEPIDSKVAAEMRALPHSVNIQNSHKQNVTVNQSDLWRVAIKQKWQTEALPHLWHVLCDCKTSISDWTKYLESVFKAWQKNNQTSNTKHNKYGKKAETSVKYAPKPPVPKMSDEELVRRRENMKRLLKEHGMA